MNALPAYRQILEDLAVSVRQAIELIDSRGGLTESSPEEILAFKRDHPNCTMIIGDFEIHCLEPQKYGLEDSTVDIEQQKALFRRAIQALSQEEKQAFRDYFLRELNASTNEVKPAEAAADIEQLKKLVAHVDQSMSEWEKQVRWDWRLLQINNPTRCP